MLLLALACHTAAEAPAPEVPRATTKPACAALPGELPAGLVARRRFVSVPRGKSPATTEEVLVARGTPCPEPTPHEAAMAVGTTRRCVALDEPGAVALWERLRAARLETVEVETLASWSPHRGGWSLELAWDGGGCLLSDAHGSSIPDASRPPFDAALAALDEAHAAGAPASGPCVAEGAPPSLLRAYDDAAPGTRHRVEMAWDDAAKAWMPVGPLDMPMHHASGFEWVNLDRYGTIDRWRGRRLVFTFTALGAEVVPPGSAREEYVFMATYRARIDSVCGAP